MDDLTWAHEEDEVIIKAIVAAGLLHPAGEQVLFDFVMCFYVL